MDGNGANGNEHVTGEVIEPFLVMEEMVEPEHRGNLDRMPAESLVLLEVEVVEAEHMGV